MDWNIGIFVNELCCCSLLLFVGTIIFLNRFHSGILFDKDELYVSSVEFNVGRVVIGTAAVVVAARVLIGIND